MNLTFTKSVWLPTSYPTKQVTKRNDRRIQHYITTLHRKTDDESHKSSSQRVPSHTMQQFVVDVEQKIIDAYASYHLQIGWNKILHLKPYYSYCPRSMNNVLLSFKQELGRVEGKRKDLKPPDWPLDKTPLHAVIEFGDKLHGIHAHALINTYLPYEQLEVCWFKANLWGSVDRRLALLKERTSTALRKGYLEELELRIAEDAFRAVSYVVGYEHIYSLIDNRYARTQYTTDLVMKMYKKVYPSYTGPDMTHIGDNYAKEETQSRQDDRTGETHRL